MNDVSSTVGNETSTEEVLRDFMNFSHQLLIKIKQRRERISHLRLQMCKLMMEASCQIDPNLVHYVIDAESTGQAGDDLLVKICTDIDQNMDFTMPQQNTELYLQLMKEVGLIPSEISSEKSKTPQ